VTFDGSGSSDNVEVVEYRWSLFVGGRTHNLTGVYASFTFEEAGEHTVKLTVIDAAGNTASDTIVVTIEHVDAGGGGADGLGWLYGLAIASAVGVAVVALVSKRLYEASKGRNKGG
jgi:PKD repeat protein